jgi:hypothetical protein
MTLCKFVKLGFLVLFLTKPIAAMEAAMEVEEDFGVDFNKLSPEATEKVLAHLSLSTWSALSQTCKDWYATIQPLLSIPSNHIDFTEIFNKKTSFKLEYSNSSFWVLARQYGEEADNRWKSNLFVIKIDAFDLKKTMINLNLQLGWSGMVTEGSVLCSGSANPVCFSTCPQGGIFVYAPVDAGSTITYVNDLGAIHAQPVLSHYKDSGYIDFICGEHHIALNSAYSKSAPILFIPYHVNVHKAVNYTLELDTNKKWPRFQKIPDRVHSICPLEGKFLVEISEINNGMYGYDIPTIERRLIIDPTEEEMEKRVKEKEMDKTHSSTDPIVTALIEKTIFPVHYKILDNYSFIRKNNLLFLLGRLENPRSPEEDIFGINEDYRDLDYRKESPYPYGIVIIKNLKNEQTIGKTFLFDNTQFRDIQHESMKFVSPHLFITTTFRKRSTPKLTAINIKPIERLLLDLDYGT